MIRAFVAIDIENESVANRIVEIQREILKLNLDIKLVERENLHFTLRFLGEMSQNGINEVIKALSSLRYSKFQLSLQQLGVFPDISRPRVLWIGVSQGLEKLRELARLVREAVDRYAAHVEREEFVPHLTMGRIKSNRNIDRLREFIQRYRALELGVVDVDKIKLKKSILTPRGPIYSDLFVLQLT